MRVVSLREGGEENLQDVLARLFVEIAQELVVALRELDGRRLDLRLVGLLRGLLLRQGLLEQLALEAIAPELVGVGLVLGPRGLLAVQLDRAVARELEFVAREARLDLRDAILDALLVEVVDLVRGVGIPEENIVIERGAVAAGEGVDVLLGEEEAGVIERLDVVLQQGAGDAVVELLARVVALLQELANGDFDLPRVRRLGRLARRQKGEREGEGEGEPAKTEELHRDNNLGGRRVATSWQSSSQSANGHSRAKYSSVS